MGRRQLGHSERRVSRWVSHMLGARKQVRKMWEDTQDKDLTDCILSVSTPLAEEEHALPTWARVLGWKRIGRACMKLEPELQWHWIGPDGDLCSMDVEAARFRSKMPLPVSTIWNARELLLYFALYDFHVHQHPELPLSYCVGVVNEWVLSNFLPNTPQCYLDMLHRQQSRLGINWNWPA